MKHSDLVDPKRTRYNLCTQCPHPGVCCYYAVMIQDKQVKTDHACPYLKESTGRCSIFAERRRNPECLTVERMIEEGAVPKWCPYVKDDQEYQARTDTRLYHFKIIEVNTP